MKKILFITMAFLCTALCFVGCQKQDPINNENLYGKWALKTITTGGDTQIVESEFYEFQSDGVYIHSITGRSQITGQWTRVEAKLTLVPNQEGSNLPENYTIQELAARRMVWVRENSTYYLEKQDR